MFALSVQLERSAETAATEAAFDADQKEFSTVTYRKIRLRAFLQVRNARSDAVCILFRRVYKQEGEETKC